MSLLGTFQRLVGPDGVRDPRPLDLAVSEQTLADLDARYLEHQPKAAGYRRELGFSFWQLDILKARAIAGFGTMGWLDGTSLLRDPTDEGIGEAAGAAIAHMNEDHVDNMREMCAAFYDVDPEQVRMVALDRTGFALETNGPNRRLHLSFGREISARDLRTAVIDVLQRARQRLQQTVVHP